jgi:hypothetical protein
MRRPLLLAALSALLVVMPVQAANAWPSTVTRCDTTLLGPIQGDLFVPSGATCTLGDHYTPTEVTGKILVARDAELLSNSQVTIGGPIMSDGHVFLFSSTVWGKVVNRFGGLDMQWSTVHGDVWAVRNSGIIGILGPNTIDGDVNLLFNTSAIAAVNNNTIGGKVVLFRNTATSFNAQVLGNFIGGSVLVVGNSTPGVAGNDIAGNLACFRNDPDPINGNLPNVVHGRSLGECVGL